MQVFSPFAANAKPSAEVEARNTSQLYADQLQKLIEARSKSADKELFGGFFKQQAPSLSLRGIREACLAALPAL